MKKFLVVMFIFALCLPTVSFAQDDPVKKLIGILDDASKGNEYLEKDGFLFRWPVCSKKDSGDIMSCYTEIVNKMATRILHVYTNEILVVDSYGNKYKSNKVDFNGDIGYVFSKCKIESDTFGKLSAEFKNVAIMAKNIDSLTMEFTINPGQKPEKLLIEFNDVKIWPINR